jgi:hypothetical protein
MEYNNDISQVKNDMQYLRELRQRINSDAEKLVYVPLKGDKKYGWIPLALFVAFILVLEIMSYGTSAFWAGNAFIISFAIVYIIMTVIMRHFLMKMKNASTVSEHYLAAKRFIKSHKLRYGLRLPIAIICWYLVKFGLDFKSESIIVLLILGSAWVFFNIMGYSYRNWFLDDDFYNDVKELGNYI